MKLVGGDSGRYEHETFVDEVLLAPSERAIVDVLFDSPGVFTSSTAHPDHTLRPRHRSPSTDEPSRPILASTEFERAAHQRGDDGRTGPGIDADRDRAPTRRWPSSR